MLSFDSVLSAIDTVGMVAFAISGALAAARQRMDVVGFVLIAVITGLGGGTLRDLLLGRLPLFWLRAPELLAIIAIAAVAVFVAAPRFRMGERLLVWADALGMALYAVLGAEIALLAGADPWAAMLLGVVTASFGGILRDVVCNEVPLLLTREIYLLAALAGAACFVSLRLTGVWRDHAVVAGMVVAFGIRAAAIRFGWSLPPYRER
ncbi:trimeric intracellular cation channel family protein [Rhodovarius crocodyli]|uniref:Trimeric intracellular cation channel family protein n=1 Tax=Rhodovarius crocodyli TaxID=1979269 RepID=A0A437MP77_9PROT|nr:trimeric intracellular cation channel family protein [Rhodovarius crocodyli]RVT99439.1 trimeric intracellular cation channel family protein [Rhodovarius crocodyli]